MKTFQLILVSFMLPIIFLTGCKKSDVTTPAETPKSLKELNAPESFSWSTSMPVTLSITGLPTMVTVKSTLTISLSDGSPLVSRLHLMSDNLVLNLTVPSTEKELTLKYGSAVHTLSIKNNAASFSFIPVISK